MDRHELNSAACLFQTCTGNQRTEAYGFGGPKDKSFPEGPQSWEGQSLGKDVVGVGKGQDLWHFPSSWKQRQIPASCVSNPVPPSQVAGAEGNTAGLRPHPVTWLLFQTISFLAWAITYFQISEMLSVP